jgi:hypothetical protein
MTLLLGRRGVFGAGRRISLSPPALVILAGLLAALLLGLPGTTVTTRGLDDLFLIMDGIQRLAMGEVPSVDFRTVLGPLSYYLPLAGYRMSGSFGGAMPAAMALVTAVLSVTAAPLLTTRLRLALALPFGLFLLFILAAPMYLGDAITALSFTMFYNRIGWVGAGLLLLLYLPAARPMRHQDLLDGACAAVLTLILLYIRLSYGLFAIAFLLLMLSVPGRRRAFAGAIAAVLVVSALVDFVWGGSLAYVKDSLSAPAPEGLSTVTFSDLLQRALGHVPDLVLFALIVAISLGRNRSLRDLAFLLLCAIGGLWLIGMNVQRWGIISIHAGAVVAAEMILRRMDERPETGFGTLVNPGGIRLYVLALLLPTILHCGLAYLLHTGATLARAGEPVSLPAMEEARFADLWTTRDYRGTQASIKRQEEALALLRTANPPIRSLMVPGVADGFSAMLNLDPADPGPTGLRPHAVADPRAYLPAPDLAAQSDAILLRRDGGLGRQITGQYSSLLGNGFATAGETPNWLLLRRVNAGQEPAPSGATP